MKIQIETKSSGYNWQTDGDHIHDVADDVAGDLAAMSDSEYLRFDDDQNDRILILRREHIEEVVVEA